MASITIHGLSESAMNRLRQQAQGHGRSVEDEARAILTVSTTGRFATGREIYEAIRAELGKIVAPIWRFRLDWLAKAAIGQGGDKAVPGPAFGASIAFRHLGRIRIFVDRPRPDPHRTPDFAIGRDDRWHRVQPHLCPGNPRQRRVRTLWDRDHKPVAPYSIFTGSRTRYRNTRNATGCMKPMMKKIESYE